MKLNLMCAFVFGLITLTGCGDGGTRVTGKVTFDGSPIETGSIVFVEVNGKGAPITGEIKNGDYSISAPNGNYKVQVMSTKKVMSQPSNKSETPTEELRDVIPQRYKGNSTELTATVDGKPINFDLKSDAPKKK